LLSDIGSLQGQVAALPDATAVATTPVVEAAPVVETPAPAPAPAPAAPEVAVPEVAVAPATPATSADPAAPAPVEPSAAAPAPADPPADGGTEVVTKADLTAFGTAMGEAFTGALSKFGDQIVTTLKSAAPAAQPTPAVATFAAPAAVSTDPPAAQEPGNGSYESGDDWGNAFDLNAE
jgi:hypothetical protein